MSTRARNCLLRPFSHSLKTLLIKHIFRVDRGRMRYSLFFTLGLPCLMLDSVCAASFGSGEAGIIILVNGKPAICVPENARKAFAVGWISLTESYTRNQPSWGASLLPGSKPIKLSPGVCMVFGVAPEGCQLDNYKIKARSLKFEVNRTYVFSLTDADRPTDSYDAVFCIRENSQGTHEYLQYTRLADGSGVIPSCDSGRNGDVQQA